MSLVLPRYLSPCKKGNTQWDNRTERRKGQKTQFAKITRNTSPSSAEYEASKTIQLALSNPTILIHADRARYLFIDLDAAKGDTGFGAMVYHVKGELDYLDGKIFNV